MNPRVILPLALVLSSLLSYRVSAQIPSNLPETRKLHQDLKRLTDECDRTRVLVGQLRSATKSTRQGVDQAIDVTSAIRAMDRRLVKLIDRLKPYHSIPKVRGVTRRLSSNLERIQKQVHRLRKKTDSSERNVLRPARDRLRELETALAGAENRLRNLSAAGARWTSDLEQAARIAAQSPAARQILEPACRSASPATSAAVRAVVRARTQVDSVGQRLADMHSHFATFRTVGHSVNELGQKMESGEKLTGNLDKVLGKQLTIKVPLTKKPLRFRIRDILEKPGDVMNVVLKPLEMMADKLLQPVLGKLKLEIPTPKGLDQLEARMERVDASGRSLLNGLGQLERQLQIELSQRLQQVHAESTRLLRAVQQSVRQPAPPVRQPAPPEHDHQTPMKRTSPVMFWMPG
ncbi:hypothetical protein FYK55_07270 [Roseiconus nitratireducens]|uniref:Uncharacterized protein n=1 Tax=Roseiconus nitratireducens TaxID=2605748 RepID=A0A5M6DGL7_9BACT|nr:hypothetical protein [Roseiconus nitratireducens]KAA5545442.1 hypothetical protein FYK55_07270 [Roseiconus nitratireducens]